jgi:hypothetical protein
MVDTQVMVVMLVTVDTPDLDMLVQLALPTLGSLWLLQLRLSLVYTDMVSMMLLWLIPVRTH